MQVWYHLRDLITTGNGDQTEGLVFKGRTQVLARMGLNGFLALLSPLMMP